jgi:hypothetical protein
MRRGIPTFLPIVVELILLPPIAFSNPPDPSWIAGIYDGADGDDIVTLVYETAATNAAAPSKMAPLPCLPGISLESIVHGFPGGRFTRGPRSPPDSMFCGKRSCLQFPVGLPTYMKNYLPNLRNDYGGRVLPLPLGLRAAPSARSPPVRGPCLVTYGPDA